MHNPSQLLIGCLLLVACSGQSDGLSDTDSEILPQGGYAGSSASPGASGSMNAGGSASPSAGTATTEAGSAGAGGNTEPVGGASTGGSNNEVAGSAGAGGQP